MRWPKSKSELQLMLKESFESGYQSGIIEGKRLAQSKLTQTKIDLLRSLATIADAAAHAIKDCPN